MYKWSKTLAAYRDMSTGRFVSKVEVRNFVGQSIEASTSSVQTLTTTYQGAGISVSDWKLLMRSELRKEHIRQYILGRGGREQMTPSDWGTLGNVLKRQYKYLTKFGGDLESGKVTGRAALNRALMYPAAARESYERGQRRAMLLSATPPNEVSWNLDEQAENCQSCVRFDEMGWQPIDSDPYSGAYPGSGDTECLTHCKCSLKYRFNPELIGE